MAEQKISDFDPLTDLANDDLLVMVDTSEAETVHCTRLALLGDESSFSPTLGASTVDGTHGYITQSGIATLVGNMCHFQIELFLSSVGGTISGSLRVKGLPYTAASVNAACAVGAVSSITVSSGWLFAYVFGGSTEIVLQRTTGTSLSNLTDSDLGFSPRIHLSGSYRVA